MNNMKTRKQDRRKRFTNILQKTIQLYGGQWSGVALIAIPHLSPLLLDFKSKLTKGS